MRSSLITVSLCLFVLPAFAACGDDGGSVCGEGTIESEGTCIPEMSVAGNGPAARRLCNTDFGPVGENALFVNAAHSGDSDGTRAKPFLTIQDAVDAASPGQEIGVAAGTYVGDVSIAKPVLVEGRCAADVTVQGSIDIKDTGAVALRGLSVTGGSPGVLATNVQPQDGSEFGLEVQFLIATQNDGAGLEMNASSVRIQDSEFTLTRQVSGGDIRQLGSGIFANDGSLFDIRASVVIMNGFMGVDVADATGQPLTVDQSQPKATATSPSTGVVIMNGIIGNEGGGVRVLESSTSIVPNQTAPIMTISGNDFSDNVGFALEVNSTRVDILANTFKGSAGATRGMQLASVAGTVANNSVTDFPTGGLALNASADVSVIGNTLSGNSDVGILSHNSSDITINGNTIDFTISRTSALESGHGVYISAGTDAASKLLLGRHFLSANQVNDNAGVGIGIESLTQGDTIEPLFEMYNNTIARNSFAGINLQEAHMGLMSDNNLDSNTGFGIRCMANTIDNVHANSRVFFDGNTINGTKRVIPGPTAPSPDGDAILASHCHVQFNANTITANARYGLYFLDQSSGNCEENDVTAHQPFDIMDGGGGMNISPSNCTTMCSGDNGAATTSDNGAEGANLDPVTGPAF